MNSNSDHIYTLLQSIEGILWDADTDMCRFSFISDQAHHIIGFSTEDWLIRPGLWKSRIHPEDINIVDEYLKLKHRNVKSCAFEYRMIRADGEIIWVRDNVSLVRLDNGISKLRGIMLDNTIAERLRALERLEHNVLRLNSDLTNSLREVLLNYLKGLEAIFPQMQCSIHLINNGRIVSGLSPSLPTAYIEQINGLHIGENEGSCGTAAATRKQVIVSDIATDYRWKKYRSIAADNHLSACWSNPLINADGKVMATLAMYYKYPRSPSEDELQVMERATALLRIIIENREKNEIINDANLLMLQSQELARFGTWRWDVQQNKVSWSPAMYLIYDIDKKCFDATSNSYIALLHPDDQDRVSKIFKNILESHDETEFEERIIRPNGELRYLRSWAKVITDAQGVPLEMIGACQDITENVIQNRQLIEIAWMQSHAVRAPLTKIMALVDLIKKTSESDPEKNTLLEYLSIAASEMDEQIKLINEKAAQSI